LTPALLAATALEKDASLPEALRRDVEMIRRNVELETRLIDDLLDLTRIANNKLELHTELLDLHAVLSRASDICRPEIQQKSLRMDVQLGAKEPNLDGDSVRLQQALWNLIRNAVKFTPSGGAISIITDNPRKNVIRIQVKDTGVGFAPDAGQTLFEAFVQGGRSITRQFGGLGLGLAITRSIVEAHGGTIRAESPGLHRGAIFAVELPTERKRNAKDPDPRSREGVSSKDTRSLRILLIEDHDDTRMSLDRLLRRFGHQVAAASTAREGLELAGSKPFDLVISDIGLPDLSGEDLMSELRDRFGLIGVAVSGYGMEADVARCRIGGFAHHLTKPIQIEHLKQIINEVSDQISGQ
jgi:CheY-like chemotaxis protein